MKYFKMNVLILGLSVISMALSGYTLLKLEKFQSQTSPEDLTKILLDRVKECVLSSSEFTQKNEILHLIEALDKSGAVSETGSDALRVKYVSAQGTIEHVLACAMVLGDVGHLVGVIHTPTPATPLCTKVDNLDDQLLDSSIRFDIEKLLTVRSRAVIVREYLEQGGKLFVAYPKGGLEKRSTEQQAIYKQELDKYAQNLIDAVLSCTEMDPAMVGATYFFKDKSGHINAFSIKSMQANNPLNDSEWGMWFGKINDPIIHQRVDEILHYLESCNGPDIRSEIAAL